MGDSDVRNM